MWSFLGGCYFDINPRFIGLKTLQNLRGTYFSNYGCLSQTLVDYALGIVMSKCAFWMIIFHSKWSKQISNKVRVEHKPVNLSVDDVLSHFKYYTIIMIKYVWWLLSLMSVLSFFPMAWLFSGRLWFVYGRTHPRWDFDWSVSCQASFEMRNDLILILGQTVER